MARVLRQRPESASCVLFPHCHQEKLTMYWKVMLDVVFAASVTGTIGFIATVKQKEELMYMNIILVSILCLIYSFYFNFVRKKDMERWLERNDTSERPCVTFIRRKLRNFIYVGIPYLWVSFLKMVIVFYIIPFPVIALTTAWLHDNLTVPLTVMFLSFSAFFYISISIPYLSGSSMKTAIISLLLLLYVILICVVYIHSDLFEFSKVFG